jgi:hypothetical protein
LEETFEKPFGEFSVRELD